MGGGERHILCFCHIIAASSVYEARVPFLCVFLLLCFSFCFSVLYIRVWECMLRIPVCFLYHIVCLFVCICMLVCLRRYVSMCLQYCKQTFCLLLFYLLCFAARATICGDVAGACERPQDGPSPALTLDRADSHLLPGGARVGGREQPRQ